MRTLGSSARPSAARFREKAPPHPSPQPSLPSFPLSSLLPPWDSWGGRARASRRMEEDGERGGDVRPRRFPRDGRVGGEGRRRGRREDLKQCLLRSVSSGFAFPQCVRACARACVLPLPPSTRLAQSREVTYVRTTDVQAGWWPIWFPPSWPPWPISRRPS